MIGRACPHYKVCKNNIRCMDCDGESLYLSEKKEPPKKTGLGRKGVKTEKKAVKKTNDHVKKSIERAYKKRATNLTPNSGAGSVKGDALSYDLMQEMKERNHELKGGNKSISIQKEWLEKLEREAYQAGKPYYILPFTFGEDEKKIYTILDYDVVMGIYADIVYLKETIDILEKKIAELEE